MTHVLVSKSLKMGNYDKLLRGTLNSPLEIILQKQLLHLQLLYPETHEEGRGFHQSLMTTARNEDTRKMQRHAAADGS